MGLKKVLPPVGDADRGDVDAVDRQQADHAVAADGDDLIAAEQGPKAKQRADMAIDPLRRGL